MSDDTSQAREQEQHEAREEQFRDERAKVGSGWHPIIDELHANLGMLLGDYDVLQIKEQSGGLRYYILLEAFPGWRLPHPGGHSTRSDWSGDLAFSRVRGAGRTVTPSTTAAGSRPSATSTTTRWKT